MREREKFSGTGQGEIATSQICKIAKKYQNLNILQISFVMWWYLMYSIVIIIFGWKLCSKYNVIAIFKILANFAAFHDHTKEDVDMSKNDG